MLSYNINAYTGANSSSHLSRSDCTTDARTIATNVHVNVNISTTVHINIDNYVNLRSGLSVDTCFSCKYHEHYVHEFDDCFDCELRYHRLPLILVFLVHLLLLAL